jgi:soluble lytic murein transglycosylase-like protein
MWLRSLVLLLGLSLPATAPQAVVGSPTMSVLPDNSPVASRPYQRSVIREGRALFGMNAPSAMFGAQIQTESGWRPNAHSIYAAGLAQFIPSTAAYMARRYPLELGSGNALDPEWSIRALVRYDYDLFEPIRASTVCDRWAFTLSAYNGGPGWIPRDRALTIRMGSDPSKWWGNVELYTSRSASNAQQNREYPRRILIVTQPAYKSWGGFVSCGP